MRMTPDRTPDWTPDRTPDWRLPDPETQPEFYADVSVKRLLAFVIDAVLLLIIAAIIVLFTAGLAMFFIMPVWWMLNLAYRTISLANGSATPGMRLLAIEFRNRDGQLFDLTEAFWHSLFFMLAFSVFPLQLVSMLLMAISERGQGLGDLALGSVAINRRARS